MAYTIQEDAKTIAATAQAATVYPLFLHQPGRQYVSMPKDWSAQISHVNFRCGECRRAFEGEPDLIEDAPEQAHHPYAYFAHCPHCGAEHQPQASWERALLKAHQFSTGPKTPDRMTDIVQQAQTRKGEWAKERAGTRAALVVELRAAEKSRANLYSLLELHGKDAPNLGDMTVRLRELNQRIKTLEESLLELENEPIPTAEMPNIDPADVAEVLRGIVLDCADPKKLREFLGAFVKEVTVSAEEVVVDYHPECLVRLDNRTRVRSADIWLLDLGSNQGPTD